MSPAYGARGAILKFVLILGFATGEAEAETRVIAMLGDSLTQGYGLAVEQGLVPTLQRWLTERGADVRLINAGVSGDTTAGGAARVDWTLTPEVDGLIVSLGANDMLRGIEPQVARGHLETILATASDRNVETMLIGFPAPGNYGTAYQTAFEATYETLADEFDTVFLKNLLAPLQSADAPISTYLQADQLHPNPDGVELIVEGLGPGVLDLIDRLGN